MSNLLELLMIFLLFFISNNQCRSEDPMDDFRDFGADMCPECNFENNPSNSDTQKNRVKKIDEQIDRLEGLVRQFNDLVNRFDQDLSNREDGQQIRKMWGFLEGLVSKDVSNSKDVELPGSEGLHSKLTGSSLKDVQESPGSSSKEPSSDVELPSNDVALPGSSLTKDTEAGNKRSKGRIVARYKPSWSDYFQFLSAVRVDAPISCLHILPHAGEDGMSKYVAVGDEAGHLYIFSLHGDLLVDKFTTKSPVMVMMSLALRRNETLVITGHANGDVHAHRVWEILHEGISPMEDWTSLGLEYSHSFVASKEEQTTTSVITNLEMYRVGRMRYLLVADNGGKVQVFRENGTLYGTATSPNMPLAFLRTSNTQRLLFLTSRGASSLDLRSMIIKNSPCEGLNSSLVAFAFDAFGRSKAYGVTDKGEVVYLALSGDTLHFGCHAKVKRKLELDGPVFALHGLKGYILVATPGEVSVYNTSLQPQKNGNNYHLRSGNSRSVFTTSMDDISLAFVASPPRSRNRQALVACDRDRVVVLGFGDGYFGIFKSNLPLHSGVNIGWANKMPGGTSAFVTILVLAFAWYYFFSRKRDQLSRQVDDPLPAAAAAAAAPPGFGSSASATSGRPGSGAATNFDKVRGGGSGSEGREGILEEPTRRRFGSPSSRPLVGTTGTGSPGTGTANYSVLKYRNTAVEHYGTSSIRSTSSQ